MCRSPHCGSSPSRALNDPWCAFAFFGRDDRVEEDREGGFGARRASRPRRRGDRLPSCPRCRPCPAVKPVAPASSPIMMRRACSTSSSGTSGWPLGMRYLSTAAVMPCCGEPLGHVVAFVIDAQLHVTAAGADHDGLPRGFLRGRPGRCRARPAKRRQSGSARVPVRAWRCRCRGAPSCCPRFSASRACP